MSERVREILLLHPQSKVHNSLLSAHLKIVIAHPMYPVRKLLVIALALNFLS